MPTPSLLVVRESGHGAAATRSGVDEQYASRHSAWLHCPARDCRRSCRVVRGFAVRAAAASARAWRRLPARHRAPSMQWRALPRPARLSISAWSPSQDLNGPAASITAPRPECSLFRHGYNGAPGRPPHHRVAPKHDRAAPERRRQCFHGNAPGDDHQSRAGTRSRRSARPSGRAWAVSPGADHMAIAKPSASPPRSRSRRRSSPHEVVDLAPPGHQPPEANVPARAGELAQYAADGVPRARSHVTAARTKERFFASQATARGPIVAPSNTRPCPSSSSQILEKLYECSEFLDSGGWAIQDSNLGPLPYQEDLLSPPVPPTRT